jgi:diguanylate cyclase
MSTLSPTATGGSRARWFSSLKLRLALASTLIITASVALATSVVLDRVQQRSEQTVVDLEAGLTEHLAAILSGRMVALQNTLRRSSQVMPVAARTDAAAAVAFVDGLRGVAVNFSTLYLIDSEGRMLALFNGSSTATPNINVTDRPYFRNTLERGVPLISEPMVGRASHEPVIQVTMPVLDAQGRAVAVLGGGLRLSSRNLFDDLTYTGSSGRDQTLTIVADSRGAIISHPQRFRIMDPLETESGLANAATRWAAQGRPIEPSGLSVHEDRRFVSMAGVPGTDWMVFRLRPDEALLGSMTLARKESVQWAGGVALLGGLLILGWLTLLLGPLNQLRRRAQAFADNSLPIDEGWPAASGEIGELTRVLRHVLRERASGEQDNLALVQRMRSMMAAAPIGIAFSQAQCLQLASAEFSHLLGYAEDELVGRLAREIFASEVEYDALGSQVRDAFTAGRPLFTEIQFKRRDGTVFWGRLQGRPVEPGNSASGTIWLLEDVTERREARARLSWSASHDTLTRLLNRGAFEERLTQWLAQGQATASLMFLDLDRFKLINDTAGHAAGDGVLRDVAALLQDKVRAGDAAARLGGDEFAVLLPGCPGTIALQLAERVREAIGQVGIDHDGRRLNIGASIGLVALDSSAALSAEQWLARADAACYEAKHAGRNAVRLAGDNAALRLVAGAS